MSSSPSANATAATLIAAVAAGAAVSTTVSIIIKIGWSKAPPTVKNVIVKKGEKLKRTLSSSSVALKDQLKRAVHQGISSHSSPLPIVGDEETLLKDPSAIFESMTLAIKRVANEYSCGRDNHPPSTSIDEDENLACLPKPRLFLSMMTLLHALRSINKRHPEVRENTFSNPECSQEWDDEDELELVSILLDFCHWVDCIEQGRNTVMNKSNRKALHPNSDSTINLPTILRPLGFKLISKMTTSRGCQGFMEPFGIWQFGYFLAAHHGRKQIVLAIGCLIQDDSDLSSSYNRKHSTCVDNIKSIVSSVIENQMLQASFYHKVASRILDDAGHLIDHFFVPCGYQLFVTGHGISAGVACRLGMELKRTRPSSTKIKVYAFGPPPCVNSTDTGCRSTVDSSNSLNYITSIVNNSDCIPRLSKRNVGELIELLGGIDVKLKRWALCPHDLRTARQQTKEMEKLSSHLFLTAKEQSDFLHNKRCKATTDKYNMSYENQKLGSYDIPGRVIFLWNHTQDESIIGATLSIDSKQTNLPLPQKKLVISDEMLYDHTYSAYRNNFDLLIEQMANSI